MFKTDITFRYKEHKYIKWSNEKLYLVPADFIIASYALFNVYYVYNLNYV